MAPRKEADRLKMGRMTWAGFGIAAIGWVLLIVTLVAGDTLTRAGSLVAGMALRGDAVTLAQTLVLTGFGIATVGALQAGFGAFTRFFDAVLQRSVTPRPRDTTTLEPEPFVPEPIPMPDPAPSRAPEIITVRPTPVARERPDRPVAPERPRGMRGKERNYVVLSDGSVEVETVFGTRLFANLEEAKEFIR